VRDPCHSSPFPSFATLCIIHRIVPVSMLCGDCVVAPAKKRGLNSRLSRSWTALHWACASMADSVALALVQHGASLFQPDGSGLVPLYMASPALRGLLLQHVSVARFSCAALHILCCRCFPPVCPCFIDSSLCARVPFNPCTCGLHGPLESTPRELVCGATKTTICWGEEGFPDAPNHRSRPRPTTTSRLRGEPTRVSEAATISWITILALRMAAGTAARRRQQIGRVQSPTRAV